MKCWVCFRQAKGFGHVDLRFKVGHPKRYPIDWIFCSLRCPACFHRLYAVGDPSDAELAAMQQCRKPLGEAASEIGMDRALSSYTQQEALALINAVVTTYVEAMVQEHERSKYPPVRMQLDAPPMN